MKNVLAVLLLLMGLSTACNSGKTVYEDVSKERFAELIESGEGLLIDLRTPEEYEEGHIEGSVNIDFFANDFETEIAKLDKNKPVYIYCASGGRSGKTFKLMKEKEFSTVYHLPIGYNGWSGK